MPCKRNVPALPADISSLSFSAEPQAPFRHAALAEVLRSSQHNRAHHELAESSWQRRPHSSSQSCLCCAGPHLQRPDISGLKSILQQEWDHARNCHLGSVLVNPFSTAKVWWRCDKCPDGRPHQWESEVRNRSEGCGCPLSVQVELSVLTTH